MNARGALEIIVATIGVSVGVLTGTTYTIIVVVAIVTSLLAPPILRVALDRIEPSEAERRRSARREREARSFLGSVSRVLLPTRCSRDAQFAAQLVGHVARNREMDVTTMYVTEGEDTVSSGSLVARVRSKLLPATSRPRANDTDETAAGAESTAGAECLSVMDRQLSLPSDRTRHRTVPIQGSASETVIEELRRGYDLLAVGANFGSDGSPASSRDDGPTPPLFETGIDRVLQRTTAPVLAVSANGLRDDGGSGRDQPLDSVPIRRILVPTVGTEYSRHAAEMAFAIAADSNALVEIVHVVDVGRLRELFVGEGDLSESVRLGAEIVDREATLGRQLGTSVLTDVLVSEHPTRAIVDKAAESGADLVVLGSGLRPLSRRAFLGHRAEYVLKNAPCPVAVVSSR